MSEVYRIGGDDGDLLQGGFGTTKVGDASDTLDELAGGVVGSHAGQGFWLIIAKAATGSIFGTVPVGAIFPADGDEVPIVGDEAQFGTFASVADLVEWDASVSAKEFDQSLLRDDFEFVGVGKKGFEGNIVGQNIIGVTDQAGGMLNRFFPIVRKTAAGVVSFSDAQNEPFYVLAYIRYSDIPGEHSEFFFAKVNVFGFSAGAKSGSTQTWKSKMKLAGGVRPCFIDIEQPAA